MRHPARRAWAGDAHRARVLVAVGLDLRGPPHQRLYFLLGVGWGIEGPVATLTVHYADDHKFVPARKDRFLYAVQWVNPRSGVPVQSLEFTGAGRTPIPILLSVTGHGT